jgi:integrase/recombinase XerC
MPRQLRFTGVSNEFRNQMLVASLKGRLGENWDVTR